MERFLFGSSGGSSSRISRPFGLAAHGGELLVCDTHQRVVHVIDFINKRWNRMGDRHPGRLLKPLDIAVDDAGTRFVADANAVVVFSATGEPLRTLAPAGRFRPVAIAVRDGKLYVVNGAEHRVEVLDPQTGALLLAFGGQDTGPGRLTYPSGIAVDAEGRVHVPDAVDGRVAVFTNRGRYLRSIGSKGDRAGAFARPKHVAMGSDGILYVVDAGLQRVQMFDKLGRVLMVFGAPKGNPGGFVLPAGICTNKSLIPHLTGKLPPGFTADYLVFVSDPLATDSVSIYAFGSAGI